MTANFPSEFHGRQKEITLYFSANERKRLLSSTGETTSGEKEKTGCSQMNGCYGNSVAAHLSKLLREHVQVERKWKADKGYVEN